MSEKPMARVTWTLRESVYSTHHIEVALDVAERVVAMVAGASPISQGEMLDAFPNSSLSTFDHSRRITQEAFVIDPVIERIPEREAKTDEELRDIAQNWVEHHGTVLTDDDRDELEENYLLNVAELTVAAKYIENATVRID